MKNKTIRISLLLVALLVASLACNYPGSNSPVATPTVPVPVSADAVQDLEQSLKSAAATAASGGIVELTITESQLTSIANAELQGVQDPTIENVQIYLRDGQVQLSGNLSYNGANLESALVLLVSIGTNGLPKTEVVSAKLGPFPLPDSIAQIFLQEIEQALANLMVYNGQRIILQSLTIADGVMKITGYLN